MPGHSQLIFETKLNFNFTFSQNFTAKLSLAKPPPHLGLNGQPEFLIETPFFDEIKIGQNNFPTCLQVIILFITSSAIKFDGAKFRKNKKDMKLLFSLEIWHNGQQYAMNF